MASYRPSLHKYTMLAQHFKVISWAKSWVALRRKGMSVDHVKLDHDQNKEATDVMGKPLKHGEAAETWTHDKVCPRVTD